MAGECDEIDIEDAIGIASFYVAMGRIPPASAWVDGKDSIGVTAGASAPEVQVQAVVQRLRSWGGQVPSELSGREEHVVFGLPKALRV